MPLQKRLPFKKIYKKDFWINASNSNGFTKLLTKRISYRGTEWTGRYGYGFCGFYIKKITGLNLFPRGKENLPFN